MSHSPARRKLLSLGGCCMLGGVMLSNRVYAASQPIDRPIPRSGERLPVIGLGTWQVFDVAGQTTELNEARATLQRFVELGGRMVDSSPMYGSAEDVTGELTMSLGVRERLFIATKVWTTGRSAGIRQMEASMAKLRAPRLDLIQVHNLVDAATHLATLRDWKKAGRIRYLGVTHYTESAYQELERYIAQGDLDFVQLNYSLGERAAEGRILKVAAETQTAVIVNRPFMEGALFRRVRGKPLPDWAADFDCRSWAQFFLKWIIAHPAIVCAIPGTRNPLHIADNLGAAHGRLPDAGLRQRMVDYLHSL